jgi:Protein of unknown function (DUF3102)
MSALPLQTSQAGSNRLPIIAIGIKERLAAAESATRRGLEHAIAAGLLLIEAKELVAHGEWLDWLQTNCQLSQRQAQTYMRLARKRHIVGALKNAATAHLTITAAEALVGKPKPERPHGLPGQLDLLGLPPVPPPSPIVPAATPDHAPFDLIADLEQALAVIRAVGRKFPKRGAQLHATASTITVSRQHLSDRMS